MNIGISDENYALNDGTQKLLTSASSSKLCKFRKCENFPYYQSIAKDCKRRRSSCCANLKRDEIEARDKEIIQKSNTDRKINVDHLKMKKGRKNYH